MQANPVDENPAAIARRPISLHQTWRSAAQIGHRRVTALHLHRRGCWYAPASCTGTSRRIRRPRGRRSSPHDRARGPAASIRAARCGAQHFLLLDDGPIELFLGPAGCSTLSCHACPPRRSSRSTTRQIPVKSPVWAVKGPAGRPETGCSRRGRSPAAKAARHQRSSVPVRRP